MDGSSDIAQSSGDASSTPAEGKKDAADQAPALEVAALPSLPALASLPALGVPPLQLAALSVPANDTKASPSNPRLAVDAALAGTSTAGTGVLDTAQSSQPDTSRFTLAPDGQAVTGQAPPVQAAPLAPSDTGFALLASSAAPTVASAPVSSRTSTDVSSRPSKAGAVGGATRSGTSVSASASALSGSIAFQPAVAGSRTPVNGSHNGASGEAPLSASTPSPDAPFNPTSSTASLPTDLISPAAGGAAQTSASLTSGDAAGPAQATVANLSAQIVTQSGGKTSRFDLQLDPLGLGRVDVAVQIDAKGRASASLSFEKSDSASLLQSHVDALSNALTQAGLTVAPGAISFAHVRAEDTQQAFAGAQTTAHQGASGGFSGGGQNSGQNAAQNFSQNSGGQNAGQGAGGQDRAPSQSGFTGSRAFDAASDAAAATDQQLAAYRTLAPRGVDIRI